MINFAPHFQLPWKKGFKSDIRMKIKRNIFSEIEEANENDGSFSLIADFDGNEETIFEEPIDEKLPILPLRNMVLFPGVVLPVSIGRSSSLKLVKQAFKNQGNWCFHTESARD